MGLDRLAYNALSRIESGSGKAGKAGRSEGDRLPPGRHRLLFHGAPYAILLVDPQGRIRDANHEAVRLGGWDRDALRRHTLNSLVRQEGRVQQDDGLRVWQGRLVCQDGRERDVSVLQGRPLGDQDGLRPYFLTRADREAEVHQRSRAAERVDALGTFAHGLALEMANRMTALVGHLEMLGDELASSHPALARLSDARRSLDGLELLTRDIGALGRIEKARPAVVELATWLPSIEGALRDQLRPGVGLDLQVTDGGLAVAADPAFLERALVLCARQADRAMPGGGLCGVLATGVAGSHRVHLTVRDTGSPLAAGAAQHLFVPFATIRRDGRDAGTDLALAHALLVRSGVGVEADPSVDDGLALRLVFAKPTIG